MKKIVIAAAVVALAAGAAHAERKNFVTKDRFCVIDKEPQAQGPVGAVVETAGVFAGKIASATEIAVTGERKIMVENETGDCRIFPFSVTTRIADRTFNTATFDQLKKGEPVKVEYTEKGGSAVADKVTIGSGAEKGPAETPAKK